MGSCRCIVKVTDLGSSKIITEEGSCPTEKSFDRPDRERLQIAS